MKRQNLTFSILGLLAMVFLMSFVAAGPLEITDISAPANVNEDAGSFDVTFNITYTGTADVVNVNFSDSTISLGSMSIADIELDKDESMIVTTTVTGFDANGGQTLTGTINAETNTTDTATGTFSTVINNVVNPSFCKNGAINYSNLDLKIDIDNRGEGENNEWLPLDLIEVDVELENDKDDDLDNVIFEVGLFKVGSDSNNIIDDMIWISEDDEEFKVGDIKDGKDDKHVFEFKIDPDNVDEGNYWLKIKAYPKGDEEDICIDFSDQLSDSDYGNSEFYAEVSLDLESDDEKMIVVDVDELDKPVLASCGQNLMLELDVWNIGDQDFEDQFMVNVYNSELGLDEEIVIEQDLDQGDKKKVNVELEIPLNADEKSYNIQTWTYYDYDEDDDEYQETSEDSYNFQLKVEGSCGTSPGTGTSTDVVASASLVSGGEAGEPLEIKVTISNSGTSSATYLVSAAGYGQWATSADISDPSLNVGAGSSRDVTFTFDVKDDASGENFFDIEVLEGSNLILKQAVSVDVQEATSGFSQVFGDNWYLWLIGVINLILVIIIIIVAVKIARS